MTNALTVRPDNPAELGYPATLPIEIALKTAPIEAIKEAYNLSEADWETLHNDPRFVADLAAAHELLKKEGMSFKLKARLQSEELLKTSWHLIHSSHEDVPPSVKADLLKFTIRCAGLESDPKKESSSMNNLQININLG